MNDTVTVRRFHGSFPDLPDLYHTYCTTHTEYGICAEKDAADHDARMHEWSHATTPAKD